MKSIHKPKILKVDCNKQWSYRVLKDQLLKIRVYKYVEDTISKLFIFYYQKLDFFKDNKFNNI